MVRNKLTIGAALQVDTGTVEKEVNQAPSLRHRIVEKSPKDCEPVQ